MVASMEMKEDEPILDTSGFALNVQHRFLLQQSLLHLIQVRLRYCLKGA